ncbi:MAG: ethanolamine utilization protein EutQ, partial [Pseudoflavonifractor sp.]
MNLSEALLREIVTKVLERTGGGDGDLQRQVDPSGVIGIHTPAVVPLPFDGHPDVLVRDVVTLAEAPRMGCGVMELKNGVSFPWTLHYDEYDIVLEGTLEIEIDGR